MSQAAVPAALNDNDKLLAILRDSAPHWVQHDTILGAMRFRYGHGCTVNSRAADLRKQGYDVQCHVETVNGRKRSSYRLVVS